MTVPGTPWKSSRNCSAPARREISLENLINIGIIRLDAYPVFDCRIRSRFACCVPAACMPQDIYYIFRGLTDGKSIASDSVRNRTGNVHQTGQREFPGRRTAEVRRMVEQSAEKAVLLMKSPRSKNRGLFCVRSDSAPLSGRAAAGQPSSQEGSRRGPFHPVVARSAAGSLPAAPSPSRQPAGPPPPPAVPYHPASAARA